jgi:hypothetical protein
VPSSVPRCEGGVEMQYNEGTSKAGKPYKGWFCRCGGDHPPEWVR